MKIEFWMTGKTADAFYSREISKYSGRIAHFVPFTIKELRGSRTRTPTEAIIAESNEALKLVEKNDYLVILDEAGSEFNSKGFAGWLNKTFQRQASRLIFLAGGPYGFTEELKKRADFSLSLSPMTFTHDMVRIIFTEQLYRALTILGHHPYQHG